MPVINPWYFYLIEFIRNLKYVSLVILFILLFLDFIYVLFLSTENDSDADETIYFRNKSITKRWKVIIFAILVILIFIPSKITMYEMLIAKNVTIQRLEKLHKFTKQDIIDIIKQIEKKSE